MMLIDGHNDLAWAMRQQYDADLDAVDLTSVVPDLHTDLPRLRGRRVGGQFWSVYVPWSLRGPAAVTATLEQIELVHALSSGTPTGWCWRPLPTRSRRPAAAGSQPVGPEGGHCIDDSLAVLRMLHRARACAT